MDGHLMDTEALDGLRGVMAVHIMLFHSFLYSKLQWHLIGSAHMPLFFILSGFVLALSDGAKAFGRMPFCGELYTAPVYEQPPRMDGWAFYRRRFARTVPLYYISNLMCVPLVYLPGNFLHQDRAPFTYILTLFGVTTWLGAPMSINGPSWFVSTLWFFYWCFPALLPVLQEYSIDSMRRWIVVHYFLQIVFGVACFLALYFAGYPDLAFVFSTFWPPSRFPVFIMGVLAGLLRVVDAGAYDPVLSLTQRKDRDSEWWARRVDAEGAVIVLMFGVGFVVDHFTGGPLAALWLQLLLPISQLTLVYGLSCDDKLSTVSRMMRTRLAAGLGKISYALYLVHWPLIQYVAYCVYGSEELPLCDCDIGCDDSCEAKKFEHWGEVRLLPVWCIPIHIALSFAVAIVTHRYVEEPIRKLLRPKPPDAPESSNQTASSSRILETLVAWGGYGTFPDKREATQKYEGLSTENPDELDFEVQSMPRNNRVHWAQDVEERVEEIGHRKS